MIYGQLARFLLPLVLTMLVHGLSGLFINGGMARVPRATETLAAFGLAWGLTDFLASPISQTTPLRGYLLEELIGIGPELAGRCAIPLFLFSFFPLVVMIRAYLNGVALVEHRTRVLAPSGPARIGIILAMLTVLPAAGVYGATLGVAALLSGFALEAAVVWLGV